MWNQLQACKNLGIQYRVTELDGPTTLGASNLAGRFIHIKPGYEKDKRVWIHEIAHTLLHFGRFEVAAGIGDECENAKAELEADSVAYMTCKVLGIEDRQDYLSYVKMFMSRIPVLEQSGNILDKRMPELVNLVKLILNAGGYYGTVRNENSK